MSNEQKRSQWHFELGRVALLYASGIILGLALALVLTQPLGLVPYGPALTCVAMIFVAVSVFAKAHEKANSPNSKAGQAKKEEKQCPT
jgi:hypothetical protein